MRTRSLLPRAEYPRPDRQRWSFKFLTNELRRLRSNDLRLRFLVPREEQPQGRLTIYRCTAGRYPLGPTLIMD